MASYNIHAGHCPQGKGASGAVGILKESVEDRIVKDRLIYLLRQDGHTVYDCTDDSNCDDKTNLRRIVEKCNAHKVDYDISIHLNSGRNDYSGDGSTGGVEVFCYNNNTAYFASKIANAISDEFRYTKRSDNSTQYKGVKINKNLYVLRNTSSPAILIECCFVDDKDDATAWNANRCAEAIYKGNTGKSVYTNEWVKDKIGWWYRHSDGSYTTNDWEKIGGYWYYFNESGYMVTGWKEINGYWYYMNSSGVMETGWINVNDNWFYLNADGTMIENNWYHDELNDKWYYLKDGGYMAHDELLWVGNEMYVFMSDGHMARTNDRGALY